MKSEQTILSVTVGIQQFPSNDLELVQILQNETLQIS